MTKLMWAVTAVVLMAAPAAAMAQGTKDPRNGSGMSTTAQPRAQGTGIGQGAATDTMGGAFRGTGVPNLGTSPGMGSEPVTRRN
jgi:hypothetical protein